MNKFYILLLCLFTGCCTQVEIKDVFILSLPKYQQTFVDEASFMFAADATFIRSADYVCEFEKYFNNLHPISEAKNIDVRIKCLVRYKDKNRFIDTICFGEHVDENIILNGQYFRGDSLFLNFIKNMIYSK